MADSRVIPARGGIAVTPSDSTVLTDVRALYVGVGGSIKVTMINGDVATFVNVGTGTILPINVSIVWAATTATNIIALT